MMNERIKNLIENQNKHIKFFTDKKSIASPIWHEMMDSLKKLVEEFPVIWRDIESGHHQIDADTSKLISIALNNNSKFIKLIEKTKKDSKPEVKSSNEKLYSLDEMKIHAIEFAKEWQAGNILGVNGVNKWFEENVVNKPLE